MGNEWFETFFEGTPLEFWEQAVSDEATRGEVDFIEHALGCDAGQAVLDVACGFGRHSVALASRGYRMTGIDISHTAIERARAYSQTAGHHLELVRDDIRRLDRVGEFDGAFWFGNGFGYFERPDTERVLAAIALALRPGGRFVLQTGAVAECLLPRFREREWSPTEGMLFLEDNQYRFETSCIETTYYFIRDGEAELRPGRQFIYAAAELVALLNRSGLHVEAVVGGLDGAAPKLGDGNLYLTARRAL